LRQGATVTAEVTTLVSMLYRSDAAEGPIIGREKEIERVIQIP